LHVSLEVFGSTEAVMSLKFDSEVSAAMQAGLEIEYISRWHFGTTYYIIAKPYKPGAFLQSQT